MMRRLSLLILLLFVICVSVADAQLYIRPGQLSQSWRCSLDGIGTTLTECQAIPAVGYRLYLTDVVAQSTTATAGLFLLRTGTGTNCGTGTASLLPSAATVVRLAAPGNTVIPLVVNFTTPLVAPVNSAICVLGVVTNTTTIQLTGFVAP